MPPQAALAPGAVRAGEVDFAHHAPADQSARIGLHHLAHELMAGRARKAVIAALQLQIGIADAAGQQADQRETSGPLGNRNLARSQRGQLQGVPITFNRRLVERRREPLSSSGCAFSWCRSAYERREAPSSISRTAPGNRDCRTLPVYRPEIGSIFENTIRNS